MPKKTLHASTINIERETTQKNVYLINQNKKITDKTNDNHDNQAKKSMAKKQETREKLQSNRRHCPHNYDFSQYNL